MSHTGTTVTIIQASGIEFGGIGSVFAFRRLGDISVTSGQTGGVERRRRSRAECGIRTCARLIDADGPHDRATNGLESRRGRRLESYTWARAATNEASEGARSV